MARSWLINSRGIAKKVRNATRFSNHQIEELGSEACRECPNCKHIIDNTDVSVEWPGLPAGVKFDPSDLELLEHLASKVGIGSSKPHMFIDEFIPTLEEDQGICYTHPENLPGAKKDGSSIHFFHRTSNAYNTGHRKRRKIDTGSVMSDERVRWHKTGKTKPVFENGFQKGWKKILVLYRSSKRGCKPDKANWVMHQYHLGPEEDEKDGGLVVSKIFYQQNPKHMDNDADFIEKEADATALGFGYSPRTPKTNTPQPPRPTSSPVDIPEHESTLLPGKCGEDITKLSDSDDHSKESKYASVVLAGESRALDDPDIRNLDESLLCREVLNSFAQGDGSSLPLDYPEPGNADTDMSNRNNSSSCGFSDLDDIIFDTPPDFSLADLQFGSQESISSWLDRL